MMSSVGRPQATRQRVLVIGPVPPIRGGIAQHTAQIVRTLRHDGFEVEVISWAAQYPRILYRRAETDPGAEPLGDVDFALKWWSPLTWIRAGNRARSAGTVFLPWVVPVHAPILGLILLLARAAHKVVHVHNVIPHEPIPFWKVTARLVLGSADRLVVHATSLADDLHRIGVTTPSVVVPHPTNVEVVQRPLPPRPPFRLLNLGYIRAYKGLDIAISAVGILRDRGVDVTLTAAGEVWGDSSVYTDLVNALGLNEAIDLDFRYVSDDELGTLLASHHLLVAPYRSATQSGVAALALAAGRGVVASNVGGLPDVVIEGTTGALAEPDNPTSFADAVERALDRIEHLHEGATSTQFTWQRVIEALLKHA